MIEIKEELKSQQRTRRAENLHNHAHSAILPTDALKLQISAQRTPYEWSFFLSDDIRAYLSLLT